MDDPLVFSDTDGCIAHLVSGRTFADIGGLWGTKNERISVALKSGASSATMVDIAPLGHSLWKDFYDHLAHESVGGCESLSADATSADFRSLGLTFDVVHCSGIIYHLPDPHALIQNLFAVTGQYLILTSMTVPEVISNSQGTIDLSGGGALYVPGLNDASSRIVREHLDSRGLWVHAINTDSGESWYQDGVPNYGPWWWLLPPSTLTSMLETVGFKVIGTFEPWAGQSTAVVCMKP